MPTTLNLTLSPVPTALLAILRAGVIQMANKVTELGQMRIVYGLANPMCEGGKASKKPVLSAC